MRFYDARMWVRAKWHLLKRKVANCAGFVQFVLAVASLILSVMVMRQETKISGFETLLSDVGQLLEDSRAQNKALTSAVKNLDDQVVLLNGLLTNSTTAQHEYNRRQHILDEVNAHQLFSSTFKLRNVSLTKYLREPQELHRELQQVQDILEKELTNPYLLADSISRNYWMNAYAAVRHFDYVEYESMSIDGRHATPAEIDAYNLQDIGQIQIALSYAIIVVNNYMKAHDKTLTQNKLPWIKALPGQPKPIGKQQ